MSEKVLDTRGRWRSKIVAFRMSEDEAKVLNELVALSGMSKQLYLIDRVLQMDVIVKPSPYLLKCLTKQLQHFSKLLEQKELNDLDSEEQVILEYMLKIIAHLREGVLDE